MMPSADPTIYKKVLDLITKDKEVVNTIEMKNNVGHFIEILGRIEERRALLEN